jgi:nitrogen PTS system EIIA component
MENPLMTLKEVAEHIRLNEKIVGRMAQRGEIPALKVARQWRFDRGAVDAWMSTRGPAASAVHQQLPAEAAGIPEPITVAGALAPERIKLDMKAVDKEGALRELVDLVIDPKEKRLSEMLFDALKAREDLCPTCVSEGVAIPHSRNALVGLVDRPILAYGRHRTGIDFGALDGVPVRHFFLLCAPNVREHLQLLSRLTRLLRRPAFLSNLAAAQQPADVLALIGNTEPTAGTSP